MTSFSLFICRNLSGNNIEDIHPDVFSALTNLTYLYVHVLIALLIEAIKVEGNKEFKCEADYNDLFTSYRAKRRNKYSQVKLEYSSCGGCKEKQKTCKFTHRETKAAKKLFPGYRCQAPRVGPSSGQKACPTWLQIRPLVHNASGSKQKKRKNAHVSNLLHLFR